ncbi:hypothetical protein [Microbispora sp. NPDC046933]|uniref:hypothetical protein n=1 Tax=Microbispora sp. NPDC046933 TaxID=3155618 RepID=UPI003403C6E9
MRDPVTEDAYEQDAYEQDGSFIRPYIAGEGQHGGEGDRFWSEDQDEQALGARPSGQGDVLSEDWRPDQPAQTPADHAEQADYAAGRTARLPVSDGDTDPRGFLGSGWRNSTDPDEDEDERSRRGGMLLRTGLIAAGVLGAIWALALWVGHPGGAECEGGAGCAAATAPVSPVPTDEPTDAVPTDAVPTDAVPSGAVPSEAPRAEPTAGPTAEPTAEPTWTRPGASAPTHTPRSRARDSGPRSTASPRPSRTRVPVDTQQRPPADERSDEQTSGTDRGTDTATSEEQAATAPTSDPDTGQPTSAPAPTQESPRRGGGLLGWLF